MTCLDEDIQIYGDFDADLAQNLVIGFELCQGSGCANEREMAAYLSEKYIFILENERVF